MATENTVDAAVGAFTRRIRRDYNITQLEITELANRKYHAGWSASSINNIETARASMTLPVLTVLARVLSELSQTQVSILTMIQHAEAALVAPDGSPANEKHLRRILVGVRNGNQYVHDNTDEIVETRAAHLLGVTRTELSKTANELFGNSLVSEIESRCAAANRSPHRPFDFNSVRSPTSPDRLTPVPGSNVRGRRAAA